MGIPVFDNSKGFTTASTSFTIGGGSDRILIFGGVAEITDITAVTYDGVSLIHQVTVGTDARIEFWYMLEADLPGAGTFTLAVTGGGGTNTNGVASYSGVDQVTPFGTPVTATGTSTPVTVAVTGTATDELVHDVVGMKFDASPGATVGALQTERWNALDTDMLALGSSEPGDGGTITMSWTFGGTADAWSTIAFALKPAAAPIMVAVNQATETNLAQTIAVVKVVTMGQSVETNVAQPITLLVTQTIPVGQANETDLAQVITPTLVTVIPFGQASEINIARPMFFPVTLADAGLVFIRIITVPPFANVVPVEFVTVFEPGVVRVREAIGVLTPEQNVIPVRETLEIPRVKVLIA